MEKPKVFANPITKKLDNSQELFYEDRKSNYGNSESIDVNKKINEIFSSKNHVYKSHVLIKTRDDEFISDIIGQTEHSILLMDGKSIRISDIIDIKKI